MASTAGHVPGREITTGCESISQGNTVTYISQAVTAARVQVQEKVERETMRYVSFEGLAVSRYLKSPRALRVQISTYNQQEDQKKTTK